jgi:uncharacterized protein (TIRG00374 family)
MQKDSNRSRLEKAKLLLKFIVTIILIVAILLNLDDLSEIRRLIINVDPLYILVVFSLHTLDRCLMTFKWLLLLRSRKLYLPFVQGLKIYCAAMVWGMFLPATVGADAIRAFHTSRIGLDSDAVLASIVVERMVGVLSGLSLGILSLILLSTRAPLDAQFEAVWWLSGAMLAGGLFLFAGSFSKATFHLIHDRLLERFQETRIMRRLRHFHVTYQTYWNSKRILAVFFGLTFVEQLVPVINVWLLAWGLGFELSFLYAAMAVPLALLVSWIPISLSGLGVYEGALILLLSPAGISSTQALMIPLIGRTVMIASWLPWWISHVVSSRHVQMLQPVARKS